MPLVHTRFQLNEDAIEWHFADQCPLALGEKTANAVLEVAKQAAKKEGSFLGREHAIYQSDNGTEYVNKDFIAWVGQDRFRHGVPYSPTTQGQVAGLYCFSNHC